MPPQRLDVSPVGIPDWVWPGPRQELWCKHPYSRIHAAAAAAAAATSCETAVRYHTKRSFEDNSLKFSEPLQRASKARMP